ncbi:MAG: hypothetical protein ACYCTH_13650 [Cellulomonas sp.]
MTATWGLATGRNRRLERSYGERLAVVFASADTSNATATAFSPVVAVS